MPPRAKPNPRIKASVNWRDVTHTAPWGADKEPIAIDAFYGYAFESHKGFPLHHDNWKDRTGRAGRDSGKRVNVLLWSEEAIKGVLNDQPDRVELNVTAGDAAVDAAMCAAAGAALPERLRKRPAYR